MGLYPSILHGEGLEAIRVALDRAENPGVATDTQVGFASLVLDNNYFEFNDKIYHQKLGRAICTKLPPAYANLFMIQVEERLVDSSAEKPLVWMRYIDDVFFIWTYGESKLRVFIDHLNSSHEAIKFTSDYSKDSISFMDVKVWLDEGGVLSTDLFCKPTDAHEFLHKNSCPSWHTKKVIPYSKALRYRGICSEYRQFKQGWIQPTILTDVLARAKRHQSGGPGA